MLDFKQFNKIKYNYEKPNIYLGDDISEGSFIVKTINGDYFSFIQDNMLEKFKDVWTEEEVRYSFTDHIYYGLFENNIIKGFISFQVEDDIINIANLISNSKGGGTILINHIKENYNKDIFLYCVDESTTYFYKKLGFRMSNKPRNPFIPMEYKYEAK